MLRDFIEQESTVKFVMFQVCDVFNPVGRRSSPKTDTKEHKGSSAIHRKR